MVKSTTKSSSLKYSPLIGSRNYFLIGLNIPNHEAEAAFDICPNFDSLLSKL